MKFFIFLLISFNAFCQVATPPATATTTQTPQGTTTNTTGTTNSTQQTPAVTNTNNANSNSLIPLTTTDQKNKTKTTTGYIIDQNGNKRAINYISGYEVDTSKIKSAAAFRLNDTSKAIPATARPPLDLKLPNTDGGIDPMGDTKKASKQGSELKEEAATTTPTATGAPANIDPEQMKQLEELMNKMGGSTPK